MLHPATAAAAGTGEGRGEGDFQAPRPLRSAALVLVLTLLPAVLWACGLLPAAAALGFGVSVVVLTVIQGCLGAYDLRRSRRLGDALLRAYPGQPPVSGLAAWRAAELTSARHRRRLARCVRQLRREIEACLSLGSPRLGDDVLLLARQLEARLDPLSGPVRAVGMLEVAATVSPELGPLFYPERSGDLPAALFHARTALEPER